MIELIKRLRPFHKYSFITICFFILLASCVQGSNNQIYSTEDVYISFVNNGLEAVNPHKLSNEELGMFANTCSGAFFYIPSIAENTGGQIIECNNPDGLNKLIVYIVNTDNNKSWLIMKHNIFVQIDGRITEQLARQYAQAIPGNSLYSLRPPYIQTQEIQYTTNTPINLPSISFTETFTPSLTETITPTIIPSVTATSHLCGSICNDGTNSESVGRGTCSSHGGVRELRYCNQ